MDELKNKLNKLIETGNGFQWENYTSRDVLTDGWGGEPTPRWITWVSRIENILKQAVKENSEPYLYFREAFDTPLKGYKRDNFDSAKENYLKALETTINLVEDGDIFDELLISRSPLTIAQQAEQPQEEIKTAAINEKKVFIVHGHDHRLKIELEIFLSRIGLQPVVLHSEVDAGQTIIEKFETNSDVAYAFILLTPDEISFTKEQQSIAEETRKTEDRARPNVIFEFGYFVAKLGRNRVCALHKGDVSIPSDLSGFIYKKVDNSIEEIGFSLIKELKSAGLKPRI